MVNETIKISVDHLSSQEGEYVPLQPGIFSDEIGLPKRSRNRDYPVYIKRGSTRCDSVIYELPDNLSVHFIPDTVDIDTPYGTYRMNVKQLPDGLLYAREITIFEGSYDKSNFTDIYRFYRQIRSSDQKKALLLKK